MHLYATNQMLYVGCSSRYNNLNNKLDKNMYTYTYMYTVSVSALEQAVLS